MPTYEYACQDCGEHLEVVQSFKEDPLTTCGSCGGRLRKVFSAAGIIFKGSGYYVTDSRKGSAAKGGGGKDKGDAAPLDAKTDSAKSDSAKSGSSKTDTSKTDSAPKAESA